MDIMLTIASLIALIAVIVYVVYQIYVVKKEHEEYSQHLESLYAILYNLQEPIIRMSDSFDKYVNERLDDEDYITYPEDYQESVMEIDDQESDEEE